MTRDRFKLEMSPEQMDRIASFVVVTDDQLTIVRACKRILARVKNAIGLKVSDIFEPIEPPTKLSPLSITRNMGKRHRILLKNEGCFIPLIGQWISFNGGYILLANPDVKKQEDMNKFSIDDFTENDLTIELFTAREEFQVSLKEAKISATTLKDKNKAIDEANRNLEIINTELKKEITERKKAEEKLKEREKFLTTIIENIPISLFIKETKELTFVRCNKAREELFGYSEEELIGKTNYDIFPRETADFFTQKDKEALASGKLIEIPYEVVRTKSKGERILHTQKIPIPDDHGKPKYLLGISEDITELKHAEKELLKLSRAIDQSPVAIVITDILGSIEYVNPAFTEITGYTREEALGNNPRVLKSGVHGQKFYKELWDTISAGKVWRGEFCNQKKSGELFWESASISPVSDLDGRVTHYIAVKEDITTRKQADEQLKQAKSEAEHLVEQLSHFSNELEMKNLQLDMALADAESANVAKGEFLANMSHEIRTPMNGIIGMTGLLLDTKLTSEQREFVEIVQKSADSLLVIINDILDFSKIESNKLELETLDFDLRTSIEDMNDLLSVRAQEKGLEYISLVDPEVPSLLRGDPGRLRQIQTNLIGNAIKFTREGEVSLHVTAVSEDETKVLLRFAIKDTGIGVSAEQKKKLFTPFTQADGSTSRKFGGTGLGLSISKQLTEMMGGKIGVEGEVGKGSTFWFTAWFEKQPAEAVRKRQETESDERVVSLFGMRILSVDDHEMNRRVLHGMLSTWGCRHDEVEDGELAIKKMLAAVRNNDPYRVAILDYLMPNMDGEELGKKIKSNPLLKETKLVMLTSAAQRGDAARAKNIGFAGYLNKPVKRTQLYECLISVVGGAEMKEKDVGRLITRHTISESRKQKLRILLAEDNITNQRVALKILQKLGYRADAVANGKEAVNALEMIPYDLVFMDMQMPEMDGIEATGVIRDPGSKVKNHKIPIIAMTANAMKGDREKCLQAGMDDYISKPVAPQKISEMLEKWLPDNEESTAAEDINSHKNKEITDITSLSAEKEIPIYNHKFFIDRMMGDEDIVREILATFLEDIPQQIDILKKYIEERDFEKVQRQAHTIKGASANIGAERLRSTAYAMEKAGENNDMDNAESIFPKIEEDFNQLSKTLVEIIQMN